VSLSGSFDEDEGFGEDEGCAFNIDESTLDNSSSIEPRKDLINEADEKALIVKNYRLAKELSDLKTKHREEAKAVTRLTMENMNLAAHMREAMGQIAALKRELLLRQKKIDQLMEQQQILQGQIETSSVPDCTIKGTTANNTPQSKLKHDERTEQDNLKSPISPDTVTPATQMKDKVGEAKTQTNNKPVDTLDAYKSIVFSTPPPPSSYDDGTKQTLVPPSPTETFHGKGNAIIPAAFEPFKTPSPLNTEKGLPPLLFSSRPNHDFDSFVASFDAHFPASVLKPKEKSPSRVVAFDEQIFPDPFFPAAASFDGIKSPGSSLHIFDRFPATHYSTEKIAPEIFTESDPKSKAVPGNKLHLVPPPPRGTQPPELSPNKGRDLIVSDIVIENNPKSQALPTNKLHQVPPPPRGKQPHESSPENGDLIVSEIPTEGNPKTQALPGTKLHPLPPPPLSTLSSPESKISGKEKEEEIKADSKTKVESTLVSSRPQGKKKSTFSDTSKLSQSTKLTSSLEFSSRMRNERDPIIYQIDTKARETARVGVKTKFRPTDSLLNDDVKHENLTKFGNENFHNISKNSDENEKASKAKGRASSSNAKENQPLQVQFKDKSLKSGRHSLGSDGASLFSTAFPAMVLPTTNSEKIAAAMDLEIRRLDSLLNTSSYSTRRSSSSTQRPISYAEPSTKTKLRRGDKFFPSSDLMTTKD